MTDTEAKTAETPQNQMPPLVINAQYTKDLSFEAPDAPNIFGIMQQHRPDIQINVDVKAQPCEANGKALYEVSLVATATCKVEETVGFVLELDYAGLFTVNVPEEHLQPMLLIECPRLLFPFARNILSDVSRDGGFPPLMLGPIDFVAMYQRQLDESRDREQKDDA